MELAELERSKDILLQMLQEMERPMRIRDEIAVDNLADTLDRVQSAAEREMAIRQIESGFNRVQNIRLALERIDDRTYGVCLRCEGEIGSKRLNAVPWASHCVRCQDIADQEKERETQNVVETF